MVSIPLREIVSPGIGGSTTTHETPPGAASTSISSTLSTTVAAATTTAPGSSKPSEPSTSLNSPDLASTSTSPPTSASSGTPTSSSSSMSSTSTPAVDAQPSGSAASSLSSRVISSASAASSTISATPIAAGKSSNTGLIAGIAVLGALLAIALGILAFLLLRRRRRAKDRRGEYAPTYEPKTTPDSPAASLENRINSLETQLHQRDAQLRESQAFLLQKNHGAIVSGLDDKHVNERFVRLSKSINDWVLSHFKTMRPESPPDREVLAILQRSQPNYASLLREPRTKYLVIRSLVAEIIVQAFSTEEFLGIPAFSELKQGIGATASPSEANEWRAQTITLLEKTPDYQKERTLSVQEISKKINSMTSSLAGLGSSGARLNQLIQVIDAAAILALDLGKQRALFKLIMEKPGVSAFDASTMEDVLQDNKGENLQGRPIQVVVFPAVVKWGEGTGTGSDRGHVISKAQVLV